MGVFCELNKKSINLYFILFFSHLPSLESPQLDFHSPTEEVVVSPKHEEIPSQHDAAEKISDVLETLKPTEQLPELPQPNQGTKGELQTERNESELTGWIKNDYLPAEGRSDVQQHTTATSKVVEDAPELKPPLTDRENILEALAHEKQEPPKTRELFDLEKTVTIELPEEKVVDATAEEPFKVLPEETTVSEAYQDPSQVLPSSR